jgi:hypothetical protein
LGRGTSGANGSQYCRPGIGGSGGVNGGNAFCGIGGFGGSYGGGAGTGSVSSGVGGTGAVRIVYPGCTRSFPATCVGLP